MNGARIDFRAIAKDNIHIPHGERIPLFQPIDKHFTEIQIHASGKQN
jgi:hypothetical protein